ncbi:hypothetical protein [Galactobacter caseinivorans]|uniref:Uncharacterized protein n=1 Tax=Galactobacter caseinivorans TaxID=2676123 RepID=A0A496PH72_9MICC|nr:hypothetical protein [Galactobacter caseinivorans]RKW69837.1 hypothetical protein DWQ67_10155 [Galactobacter caseinivorans]
MSGPRHIPTPLMGRVFARNWIHDDGQPRPSIVLYRTDNKVAVVLSAEEAFTLSNTLVDAAEGLTK